MAWKLFKDDGIHLSQKWKHTVSSPSPAEQDESFSTARNTTHFYNFWYNFYAILLDKPKEKKKWQKHI